MRTKIYDLTEEEFVKFEENVTFEQLEELDFDEVAELDNDVVREVVENEDFADANDQIYYKEKYHVPLNDEDNYYLDWANKVDADLGPPLM